VLKWTGTAASAVVDLHPFLSGLTFNWRTTHAHSIMGLRGVDSFGKHWAAQGREIGRREHREPTYGVVWQVVPEPGKPLRPSASAP